jgi:hypothetical protein
MTIRLAPSCFKAWVFYYGECDWISRLHFLFYWLVDKVLFYIVSNCLYLNFYEMLPVYFNVII